MRSLLRRKPDLPDAIEIDVQGAPLRIRLRMNARAVRYLLRLPADNSGPVMTIPNGGSAAQAKRFALQHVDWLLERLERRPEHVALMPGDYVPVRGVEHKIVMTGKLRGLVQVSEQDGEPVLLVPGDEVHVPRKVVNWLKSEAKRDLVAATQKHAPSIGKKVAGLSVRDTKSRWGSCAHNGRLSFSWRLILAPPDILDYVAAHEVAHLQEMNHSERFWRVCEKLAPQTPQARKWLKDNGARLHGYGQTQD
ncbi:MAG: M48 family metallopeptidase [Rhodobacteraceae bacterium]|nr:M48 family metallopeptidase [Paracoccaceae bacterium]